MASIFPVFIVLLVTAFVMFLLGFLLIFIESLKRYREGERKSVEGGAVIIVGPIPLVFGTSKEAAKILTILAIILTIVVVIAFIILNYPIIYNLWR